VGVLALGDTEQRKCSLVRKNQVKEAVGVWVLGLLIKGELTGQLFAVFRSYSPGRGSLSQANKAPRMLKHCKHRT